MGRCMRGCGDGFKAFGNWDRLVWSRNCVKYRTIMYTSATWIDDTVHISSLSTKGSRAAMKRNDCAITVYHMLPSHSQCMCTLVIILLLIIIQPDRNEAYCRQASTNVHFATELHRKRHPWRELFQQFILEDGVGVGEQASTGLNVGVTNDRLTKRQAQFIDNTSHFPATHYGEYWKCSLKAYYRPSLSAYEYTTIYVNFPQHHTLQTLCIWKPKSRKSSQYRGNL